jgi:site-specific DNA-methyltransferase (adenine-specific)
MAEKVVIGDAELYCGDCLEILPTLGKVDAVVTDPPYGMNLNTDSSRFSGGHRGHRGLITKHGKGRNDWGKIVNDDKPFNPEKFMDYDECILFGANHYWNKLPSGSALVWIKRFDGGFGSFLSDAEIAYKKSGCGVYCHRNTELAATARQRCHPAEKPVGLLLWCIDKHVKGKSILDPFMGSGTTGVACANLGRKFIGIEIEECYFQIACERIEAAYAQHSLFE